jgi:hypothetical protein
MTLGACTGQRTSKGYRAEVRDKWVGVKTHCKILLGPDSGYTAVCELGGLGLNPNRSLVDFFDSDRFQCTVKGLGVEMHGWGHLW